MRGVGIPDEAELACLANIRAWEECLEFVELMEDLEPKTENRKPKTDFYPLNASPAVRRAYLKERTEARHDADV